MSKAILHMVSDSTGETVSAAAAAALAQLSGAAAQRRMHVFVRRPSDLDAVFAAIAAEPGPIVYTIADSDVSARLSGFAAQRSLEAVDLLEPLARMLHRAYGGDRRRIAGGQHGLNAAYESRVAAIDFAMSGDDGASADRYAEADAILTGVSRTSKTPTCIYLACRGVKAANLPLVPGAPAPAGFAEAVAQGVPVFGLTISPSRLIQIRSQRLDAIGAAQLAGYVDADAVRTEIAEARMFFETHGATVIDVTRRSIEETAAEIMAALRNRKDPA